MHRCFHVVVVALFLIARPTAARRLGFAGHPTFRDTFRGLLPIFANAVLLGGSF